MDVASREALSALASAAGMCTVTCASRRNATSPRTPHAPRASALGGSSSRSSGNARASRAPRPPAPRGGRGSGRGRAARGGARGAAAARASASEVHASQSRAHRASVRQGVRPGDAEDGRRRGGAAEPGEPHGAQRTFVFTAPDVQRAEKARRSDVVLGGRGAGAPQVFERRRGFVSNLERDAGVRVVEVHFERECRASSRADARPSSERGVFHERGGEGGAHRVGVQPAVESEGPVHDEPAYAQSRVQRGERKTVRDTVRGTVLLPSGILGTRGAHDVDASRPCGARQTPAHGRAVRDARARGLPEPRANPFETKKGAA